MRNSDKISFVCISTGGLTGTGKTMGTKIRFTNDKVHRTKVLNKLGATEVKWVNLPSPMTKVDAIQYVQNLNDASLTSAVIQDAIRTAAARLVPAVKTSKSKK